MFFEKALKFFKILTFYKISNKNYKLVHFGLWSPIERARSTCFLYIKCVETIPKSSNSNFFPRLSRREMFSLSTRHVVSKFILRSFRFIILSNNFSLWRAKRRWTLKDICSKLVTILAGTRLCWARRNGSICSVDLTVLSVLRVREPFFLFISSLLWTANFPGRAGVFHEAHSQKTGLQPLPRRPFSCPFASFDGSIHGISISPLLFFVSSLRAGAILHSPVPHLPVFLSLSFSSPSPPRLSARFLACARASRTWSSSLPRTTSAGCRFPWSTIRSRLLRPIPLIRNCSIERRLND